MARVMTIVMDKYLDTSVGSSRVRMTVYNLTGTGYTVRVTESAGGHSPTRATINANGAYVVGSVIRNNNTSLAIARNNIIYESVMYTVPAEYNQAFMNINWINSRTSNTIDSAMTFSIEIYEPEVSATIQFQNASNIQSILNQTNNQTYTSFPATIPISNNDILIGTGVTTLYIP